MLKRKHSLSAVSIVFSAIVLSGCNGREGDGRRINPISLNADGIADCIKTAQSRNAQSENHIQLDNVTVTAFREPDIIRVAGNRSGKSGRDTPDSYDIAFSVQNHIARARVVAASGRNADINSPPVQQFNEALSRALTTYALKDNSDGGIKAIRVEGKLLAIDVEAPLR